VDNGYIYFKCCFAYKLKRESVLTSGILMVELKFEIHD